MQVNKNLRYHFIDYLRAFSFLLLLIDHSLHAYALNFGRFWFIKNFDRSVIFDVLHMHNNSIIMPALFFCCGLFVLPSFKKRGFLNYIFFRFLKLGVPFIVGIIFIVPLLTYPRYVLTTYPLDDFFSVITEFPNYWYNLFFTYTLPKGYLQAGPFWVVYCIFLYTTILVLIKYCLKIFSVIIKLGYPSFRSIRSVLLNFFSYIILWMLKNPYWGFFIFGFFSAVILGISDLMWGAHYWIGFKTFFYLQGSRFLLHAFYFFSGAALSGLGYLEKESFWIKLSGNWIKWLILTFCLGFLYIWYSISFFYEGAYNTDVMLFLAKERDWSNLFSVVYLAAPKIFIRTTLHGFFCISQLITLLAIFYTFFRRINVVWQSLAKNAYGIFLLHEVIVVWLQFSWPYFESFSGVKFWIWIKFIVNAIACLSLSWLIVEYLRKKLIFSRIF